MTALHQVSVSPNLRLAHLYPQVMNLYADKGNILALRQRCSWRGIELIVDDIAPGQSWDASIYDIVFIGGGQDSEQRLVAEDLSAKRGDLRSMAADGVVMLVICGGFQLFGSVYRPHGGPEIKGVGLIDMETVAGSKRLIGNVILESMVEGAGGAIVGFENHSGKTYLGPGARPLGRVAHGFGNNGEDGFEGAVQGSVYGTYLHGSLLPKNPVFADHLLALVLARRYPEFRLPPLDDSIEMAARDAAISRTKELKKGRWVPEWLRRF